MAVVDDVYFRPNGYFFHLAAAKTRDDGSSETLFCITLSLLFYAFHSFPLF